MPEAATQVEIKDTHRSVYTQCGETSGLVASVIVEYKPLKELTARARMGANQDRRQKKKPGMSTSEVNTPKIRIQAHRKCVGTDDRPPMEETEMKEEDEVIILKELNHVTHRKELQICKKRMRNKSKTSRQEKLYADILANENNKRRKMLTRSGDKENAEIRISKDDERKKWQGMKKRKAGKVKEGARNEEREGYMKKKKKNR